MEQIRKGALTGLSPPTDCGRRWHVSSNSDFAWDSSAGYDQNRLLNQPRLSACILSAHGSYLAHRKGTHGRKSYS